MNDNGFDLVAAAHQEMIDHGFDPDFTPAVAQQLAALKAQPPSIAGPGVRDLRSLLWSSIDNDTSRDLDQAEAAEQVSAGIRVLVAIADVDTDVPIASPIDKHAAAQTTSVYTGVRVFSMLPEQLSTDQTSLNQDTDRLAVVVDMVVAPTGRLLLALFTALWCAIARSSPTTASGVGSREAPPRRRRWPPPPIWPHS